MLRNESWWDDNVENPNITVIVDIFEFVLEFFLETFEIFRILPISQYFRDYFFEPNSSYLYLLTLFVYIRFQSCSPNSQNSLLFWILKIAQRNQWYLQSFDNTWLTYLMTHNLWVMHWWTKPFSLKSERNFSFSSR